MHCSGCRSRTLGDDVDDLKRHDHLVGLIDDLDERGNRAAVGLGFRGDSFGHGHTHREVSPGRTGLANAVHRRLEIRGSPPGRPRHRCHPAMTQRRVTTVPPVVPPAGNEAAEGAAPGRLRYLYALPVDQTARRRRLSHLRRPRWRRSGVHRLRHNPRRVKDDIRAEHFTSSPLLLWMLFGLGDACDLAAAMHGLDRGRACRRLALRLPLFLATFPVFVDNWQLAALKPSARSCRSSAHCARAGVAISTMDGRNRRCHRDKYPCRGSVVELSLSARTCDSSPLRMCRITEPITSPMTLATMSSF